MKKAEDGDGWIFQWYDAKGEETDATLTLPLAPKSVVMSDFLEKDGASVPFEKNVVKVRTKKSGVVTIKVSF